MAYDENNIFAKILRDEMPAFRVYENEHVVAFLDVMPQSSGHTLVIPRAAAENLFDLDPDVAAAVFRSTQIVARGVRETFRPDGLMLSQFNGAVAGQSVFHFHMHIVPRYDGVPLRLHGAGMADAAILEEQAERLRGTLQEMGD